MVIRCPASSHGAHEALEVLPLGLEGEDLEAGRERAREDAGRVADVGAHVQDVAAAEEVGLPARERGERVAQPLVGEVRADEQVAEHGIVEDAKPVGEAIGGVQALDDAPAEAHERLLSSKNGSSRSPKR